MLMRPRAPVADAASSRQVVPTPCRYIPARRCFVKDRYSASNLFLLIDSSRFDGRTISSQLVLRYGLADNWFNWAERRKEELTSPPWRSAVASFPEETARGVEHQVLSHQVAISIAPSATMGRPASIYHAVDCRRYIRHPDASIHDNTITLNVLLSSMDLLSIRSRQHENPSQRVEHLHALWYTRWSFLVNSAFKKGQSSARAPYAYEQ